MVKRLKTASLLHYPDSSPFLTLERQLFFNTFNFFFNIYLCISKQITFTVCALDFSHLDPVF